jgi:four helix bundle protein
VSVACNIVEGSARPGEHAYVHFLNTALASAYETRYLTDLCARLEFLPAARAAELKDAYDALCRSLQSLVNSFASPKPPKAGAWSRQSLEPRAQSPEPRA